ncbi:MAG: hypothetical protein R3C99_23770 [Pirellulaceae bacterium]
MICPTCQHPVEPAARQGEASRCARCGNWVGNGRAANGLPHAAAQGEICVACPDCDEQYYLRPDAAGRMMTCTNARCGSQFRVEFFGDDHDIVIDEDDLPPVQFAAEDDLPIAGAAIDAHETDDVLHGHPISGEAIVGEAIAGEMIVGEAFMDDASDDERLDPNEPGDSYFNLQSLGASAVLGEPLTDEPELLAGQPVEEPGDSAFDLPMFPASAIVQDDVVQDDLPPVQDDVEDAFSLPSGTVMPGADIPSAARRGDCG